jgi:hypothetical protein
LPLFYWQIFVGYSLGCVIEHNCNDHESLLVKNLALKNYKSSAVGVVKFGPLRDHVFEQVGKEMKREIQMYTTTPDASLKYHGDIKKLADYRNDQLIKDAAEKLPIVDTIIKAAFPGHKRVKNSLNKRALIISALINPWLSRSNFTYRINTLLISGGCRSEEVDCFHKLGLSSHYNTLRNMQTNAGVSHDKVLIEWKDSIVDAKMKARLLEEILPKQLDDIDTMMDVCTVDFSPEAAAKCLNYSPGVYQSCKGLLPKSDHDLYDDTEILSAISLVKKEKLPKFR